MADDIAQILWDFPAINPRTAIIAVDPGAYCIIPDETRAMAAREIERLRALIMLGDFTNLRPNSESFKLVQQIRREQSRREQKPNEREYDPKVSPCDDAEFGMKP